MRTSWLILLAIGACSFDRSGLGSQPAVTVDASQEPADAPSHPPGTPDAPTQPGTPDAKITVIDAMPPGPPDAAVGVGCGNQTCTGGNVCCVSIGGGGGMQLECKDNCGGNQATFACDGPEDCPGEECCFARSGSTCDTSCGFGAQVACRSAQDCPGAGDKCCPTQYPNVSLCAPVCF
jgi:hypothetical protein